MTPDLTFAVNVIGFAAFALGGIFYARSKVPNQTIANYKALTESQEKRVAALEDQSKVYQQNHLDSIKDIADLQGQIKVYKELPLQEMAIAMQRISTVNEGIAKSNQLILDTLNRSAGLLADEKTHPTPKGKTTTTTTTTK